MTEALHDCWQGTSGSEAVIYSWLGGLCARNIVEKSGVRSFAAYYLPVSPTRTFASPVMPQLPWGELYNRLSYPLSLKLGWFLIRPALNAARREVLSLNPLPFTNPFEKEHRDRTPIIYGFSPRIVPRPPEWGDWLSITGYWFLDNPSWQPPIRLLDFLCSGPPPVYVGFWSMGEKSPDQITNLVLRALRLTGYRGVILTDWGGIGNFKMPDYAIALNDVAHEWLLPKCTAAVIHCGGGTTAATLRAGIPMVAVPYIGDQHFWAWRIHRMGVSPKPIPRSRLSTENLAAAIQVTTGDSEMRHRAAEIGEGIRNEDGVGEAVEILHHAWKQ
jgi:UDP:flavonoid glycosyltransferase YjiC (YdhE family)